MLTRVEPRIRIEVVGCHPADGQPGRWQVAWLVHNDEPMALDEYDRNVLQRMRG